MNFSRDIGSAITIFEILTLSSYLVTRNTPRYQLLSISNNFFPHAVEGVKLFSKPNYSLNPYRLLSYNKGPERIKVVDIKSQKDICQRFKIYTACRLIVSTSSEKRSYPVIMFIFMILKMKIEPKQKFIGHMARGITGYIY